MITLDDVQGFAELPPLLVHVAAQGHDHVSHLLDRRVDAVVGLLPRGAVDHGVLLVDVLRLVVPGVGPLSGLIAYLALPRLPSPLGRPPPSGRGPRAPPYTH
eukprot:16180366-Heterocapsa_arctica.AAC.1